MSKKLYSHYAVSFGNGEYLHSGYNANSLDEVKADILALNWHEIDSDEDRESIEKMDCEEICKIFGYTLEGQDYPFPIEDEDEVDYPF